MANGNGLGLSQEVKRLIVVAVVSVVAQIVGWVAGANIVTAPIKEDVAQLKGDIQMTAGRIEAHERGTHPVTTSQLASLKENLAEVKGDVQWIRNRMASGKASN